MKKTIIIGLATLSLNAVSAPLPEPDSGIQLLPASEIVPPGYMSEYKLYEAQTKKFGYIKKQNADARDLIIKKRIAKFNDDNSDPTQTHLRSSINNVSFAFEFPQAAVADVKSLIGFAPAGGWQADKTGWDGGVELFESAAGACRLVVNSIKLSHAAVQIAKESVSYDVNEKATVKGVIGDDSSGFMYSVSWYDAVYFRTLECASKKYDPANLDRVVEIAKRAD